MLNRGNRLDVDGLGQYLVSIIREFVEEPDRVAVTADEYEAQVVYRISVDAGDLPAMEKFKFLQRSLNHIMNKATHANAGKGGTVDNEYGETP